MSGTVAIVVFFTGLLFIILIHEAGHYLVARAYGFKVEEYFVGFGPKIWSFRRNDIEYGVKALPLGGYVKIAGMNPYEPVAPEDLHRSYGAKPIRQRALVILAGPGSHFIVAAILFASWLFFFGDPRTPTPYITSVETTLNGQVGPGRRPPASSRATGSSAWATSATRRGTSCWRTRRPTSTSRSSSRSSATASTFTLVITPEPDTIGGESIGRIGVTLGPAKMGPIAALVGGVKEVGNAISESIHQITRVFGPSGIGRVFTLLFTDAQRSTQDPTSVVGIGQAVGQTGSSGDWGAVLYFLAFVTVFIGLINLLPLPPFDGGHLAVLLIEKIRGKALDMRKLIPVSAVVMSFFVVFVLATILLDLTKPIDFSP